MRPTGRPREVAPDSGRTATFAAVLPVVLMACYLAGVYGIAGPLLSPFHIDNPWFASMIHNAAVAGAAQDTFLDSSVSQGLAGTVLFGKLFAAVSAALYALAGWSLASSQAISTLYGGAAAGLWFLVARNLGLSRGGALLFALMMLVAKPFVISAMVIRPETFILLLSALAAWAALTGREALAGLAAMAAVETHPIGIVAFAYLGAVGVVVRAQPDCGARLTRLAAGVAAGAALYAALHRGQLHLLRDVIAHGGSSEMGRFFLFTYFARPGSYFARLTEAPLLLAGLAFAVWAPVRRNFPGVAWVALAATAFALLPLRGNPHYLVLVLPALILPIAAAADRADRRSLALAAICLYYAPVYVLAYAVNKDATAHRSWYPAAIAAAVPDDGVPVLGSPEEWYVFRKRRYHVPDSGKEHLYADLKTFYLIDNPWLFERYRLRMPKRLRVTAGDALQSREASRVSFPAGVVRVLQITPR